MTPAEWWIDDGPVPYRAAMARMAARVEAIVERREGDAVWLLQHPALYTAGTSARAEDLLDGSALPVHTTGRGGQYTYHGPGQRISYVMRDLRPHGLDVRAHVCRLEDWAMAALACFNVKGERRPGRVGVWVDRGGGREEKIAAIGVRVRRGVAFHGIAINVDPDLGHYAGIVPCGVREHGVTSLAALGLTVSMAELDAELMALHPALFPDAATRSEAGGSRAPDCPVRD
jgi:lipoyl(octanoyl) transferase